jgi:hypothetical protein
VAIRFHDFGVVVVVVKRSFEQLASGGAGGGDEMKISPIRPAS